MPEADLGVPGEDTGAGDEGGEMNMELEDEYDQDSERRGGGWDNAGGWSQGQERAWSSESGSDSHSNSPFVNRNGGSDWGSGGAGGAQQHRANSFSNWNKERGYKTGPTTAHPPAIPSLMQVSVPNNKGPESGAGQSMGAMAGFGAMSDAQKKKLPSWIRAGLEKMEKDKMKKEQDDERKRRFEERKRLEKLELAEEIKKDPSKSKFDKGSDNDNDTDDDSKGEPVDGAASQKAKQRKSRFEEPHQTEEKEDQALEDLYKEGEAEVTVEPTLKSKEEILAEMSSQLRALLTTLLLEVTDEEIHQISGDVIEKSLKSSKPQLQTLLSGYGSDSSASDNSDAEDSEEELKTSLSKKRSEFKALETDIRDYCAEETASYKQKEKKWLKGSTEESPLREGERSRSRSRSRSLAKSSKRNRSRSSESRRSGARNGTRNSSVDERRSISGDRKSSRRKRSRSSERSKKKSKKKGRSSSRSPSSPSRSQSRSRNKRKSRSKSEDSLKRRSQSRDSKVKKNKEKKKSKKKSRSSSRRRNSRSRSSSRHSKRKRSSSRNRRRSRSKSKGSKPSKRRSRSINRRSRSRNRRSVSKDRRRSRSRSRKGRSKSRDRKKSKKLSRSRSKSRSRSRKDRSKSRDRKKSKKISRSRSKSPKSKKKSKRSNS